MVVVHGHGVNIGKKIDPNLSVLEKAVFPYYQAGFNVLAIDLRNHGQSSYSPPVTLGSVLRTSNPHALMLSLLADPPSLFESYDIQAAVTWLRSRGIKRIGIWAESMGAASTIFVSCPLLFFVRVVLTATFLCCCSDPDAHRQHGLTLRRPCGRWC